MLLESTCQGFRSSFGFNTNLWLSKKYERLPVSSLIPAGSKTKEPQQQGGSKAPAVPIGVLRVAGQASLFAKDQDMKVSCASDNHNPPPF